MRLDATAAAGRRGVGQMYPGLHGAHTGGPG